MLFDPRDDIDYLDEMEEALKFQGSESEWKEIFEHKDFAILLNLSRLCSQRHYPLETRLKSATCIAYSCNIQPNLWNDSNIAFGENTISLLYSVTSGSILALNEMILEMNESKSKDVAHRNVPYAGFDERDIKEYDMTGYEEYEKKNKRNNNDNDTDHNYEKDFHELDEQEELDKEKIMIWILVIIQIYTGKCEVIRANLLQNQKLSDGYFPLILTHIEDETLEKTGSCLDGTRGDIPVPLQSIELLLRLTSELHDSAFALALQAASLMNDVFPITRRLTDDAEGSCVACMCCVLESQGKLPNMAEGLMHQLNEYGFPEHDDPCCIPTIRFMCQLMSLSEHGFFSRNDIPVIIDICIRELENIPGENEGLLKCYNSLVKHVFKYCNWKPDEWRGSDVITLLDGHGNGIEEIDETISMLMEAM